MTLALEISNSEGVFVGVTTGKALVRHIKERIVFLLFDDITDLFPLGL